MHKPKLQFPSIFLSRTPITPERLKSLQSVLFALYNHPDSDEFRHPLEYKQRGLTNYEQIINNPMDISTVRKMLKAKLFGQVEECLDFTQTIFENSLLYNQKTEWIITLTRKCELLFHKLVRNHLPQVVFKADTEAKKTQKKNKQNKKALEKIQTYLTEAESLAEQPTKIKLEHKTAQKEKLIQNPLQKNQSSNKTSQKSQLARKLFDLIYESSAKSLEVFYIMTKNEDVGAISTERNGNCAIDVEKLSSSFIIKATAFLKNEIQRAKQVQSKEKKKKLKCETQMSRYDI